MDALSSTTAVNGKSVGESRFTKPRSMTRAIDAVLRVAQRLWPERTAAELHVRSGTNLRSCRLWISRRHGISADALAELLRSDAGLKILEELMGDARPQWWRGFKRTVQIAELRRQQEQQRRLLAALEESAAE